jgi:hypothetical protein
MVVLIGNVPGFGVTVIVAKGPAVTMTVANEVTPLHVTETVFVNVEDFAVRCLGYGSELLRAIYWQRRRGRCQRERSGGADVGRSAARRGEEPCYRHRCDYSGDARAITWRS